MIYTGVFGVGDFRSAGSTDRRDHIPRAFHLDHTVFTAMEHADRNILELRCLPDVSAAANRDRRGKKVRPAGQRFPGSETAHGNAADINPLSIAFLLSDHRIKQFESMPELRGLFFCKSVTFLHRDGYS